MSPTSCGSPCSSRRWWRSPSCWSSSARSGSSSSRRRRRDTAGLERAAVDARRRSAAGDSGRPAEPLRRRRASDAVAARLRAARCDWRAEPGRASRHRQEPGRLRPAARMRRLERTRLLVRAGPALGLMGTLIPLSPALSGPRPRRRHAPHGQPPRRVLDHRARPAVGALAFCDLAGPRPALRPGPVRPRVRRRLRSRAGADDMIRVTPRAHRHRDRAGDPLDGLVNMFDLGIVLAVAFLLAALQSVDLTDLLTKKDVTDRPQDAARRGVVVKRGQKLRTLRLSDRRAQGTGAARRPVYRLPRRAARVRDGPSTPPTGSRRLALTRTASSTSPCGRCGSAFEATRFAAADRAAARRAGWASPIPRAPRRAVGVQRRPARAAGGARARSVAADVAGLALRRRAAGWPGLDLHAPTR